MSTNEELKKIVREKYGEIAIQKKSSSKSSCCSSNKTSCCEAEDDLTIFTVDYSKMEGYNPPER